jgi:hypothetical protein
MVSRGTALLVAQGGMLAAFDLSIPESPAPLGEVQGVSSAGGMTLV